MVEVSQSTLGWYDAHAHLADPRLTEGLPRLLESAEGAGILGWVQGGVEPADWRRQLELKAVFGSRILPVFGLHPWWIAAQSEDSVKHGWAQLEEMVPDARGIGETGLDRARGRGSLVSYSLQRKYFREHLRLAKSAQKPLVLHVVQAHDEALAELSEIGPFPRSGLVHAFSGGMMLAQSYLELGFYLSFGAEATRSSNKLLAEVIARVPSDRLMIETDCPDQSPFVDDQRKTGLNEPSFLLDMAQACAAIRKVDRDLVLNQSTENIKRLFGI